MQPTSILYIHQDGKITGSAISLRNLLSKLNREQYHPRVLLAAEGPARSLYENLNIPVDVIPMRFYGTVPGAHWYELTYYLNWLALIPNPKFMDYLRKLHPDLIHINDKAMLAAGLASRILGFRIIWHIRSSYNVSYSKLQAWVSRQIICACANHLVAISEDEIDGFEKFPNLHVIHNSVAFTAAEKAMDLREETRTSLGIKKNELVVGMVGQLSEIRGAWDFIEIAGYIQHSLPEYHFRFIILSSIPSREPRSLGWRERLGFVDMTHPEDKARNLSKLAGIEQRLIITGFRSDPLSVIAAMDIFVSCNHYGVMGRPPFEAMSVGTPIAAYAGHSGKSKVVIDGETALLARRFDKNDLANKIIHLVKDQNLRNLLGQNGKSYSQMYFNPEINAQAIEQLYMKTLMEEPRKNK